MNKELKQMLELYKNKRYKIISERMMEVDENTVTLQIKSGRRILTCSCENQGRFGNSTLCRHKQFFIMFPLLDTLLKRIEDLKVSYKIGRKIQKESIAYDMMINDLDNLLRLK